MNRKFIFVFLLLASVTYAYDPSLTTDKYTYSVNESIFAVGTVKINVTAISNVSVVFTIKDVSDSTVNTSTFVTNSSGQFNSTFSLTSAGNYTLVANVSGDVVKHFIKVLPYAKILLSLNRPSYTSGATGAVTVTVVDINSRGVASQGVTASIRTVNGTLHTSLSACTTDSLGQCQINFTAPTDDGSYLIEVNNFENSVLLVVGGYDAFMKISPSIAGKSQNVTVRVTVKNSNGNGITASTRQLVVTAPNGTQTTLASMTPANDSSGASLTGVYEDKLSFSSEGAYEVKVTIQPQSSNLTRELKGGFTVSSYLIEVVSWPGLTTLFTPGETVSLGIRLRNGSSNEFMRTTQCGSGSCTTSLSSATVLDSSGVATGYAISVSEQTSLSLYRMDIALPSTAKSGNYKVKISLNDTFGTGSGDGYFTVQFAKAKMRAVDKFPNGVSKETFLPGKQIVLELAVNNASGAVNITGVSSYSIRDDKGNDKTSIFGTGVTYSGNNNKSYINITAPNKGGRYIAKAKLNTLLGSVDAEGSLFVDVLEIEIRPAAIGGGSGGGFTPFGGPGYMFAFRPNDTVSLQVTLTTASEKRGSEGFMSMGKGGSAAGGHSVGVGGMFGIGGGTAVQGGQVIIDKIINLNTDEDATSSTTITNCITDSTGRCTLSVQSNTNGQNWTGGFYIVFVNVTTSDNQSDEGEGFFEVRRYFVNVQTKAATAKNATSSGFMSFNDWFIGPDDNINVSIRIIEPGTWQSVNLNGNATIQGVFYTGNMGEFIFPPKLQDGTTATANITNSIASAVIPAPSGGWKSGFYIVKVLVNVSGVLDTGESFLMVKIYQGFGMPVNPVTNQADFTVSSTENASIKINVFDVKSNRPAENLTVTLNKILSFESFPPSEITYDKTAVATGTTDSNGQVVITLPAPSGGWATGNFLSNFDVTNGTVTDSIQGFFQVKNFFAELSGAKWRFASNETISFNVTVSSDPSWMRQTFGGGCPPGDPMCASGGGDMGVPSGGGGGGGAPAPITVNHTFVPFNSSVDLDNDGFMDINITGLASPGFMFNLTGNLSAAQNYPVPQNYSVAPNFWCFNTIYCQQSPAPVGGNLTNGLDGVDCDAPAGTYSNTTTHNMSGPSIFCVNTTSGTRYKVQSEFVNASGINIGFTRHISGAVGGIAPPNLSGTQGFSYYNATLRSVRVVKFDFTTGETLQRQGTDYNLTSATGSTIGDGNIVIPGVGSFKLVPLDSGQSGTWSSGFYRVIAELNITPSSSDTAESGFSIETFFTNCYRSSWGAVSSGTSITIRCDVTDPGSNGAYASQVDMEVESIKNIFTFQDVSTGWASNRNFTAATRTTATIQLNQTLGNGQYEARIKLNASASDVKRQSVWFEVKDFEPSFYSERWSYSSSDNVRLRAQGISGNLYLPVNLSFTGSSPELVVYRYDKSTGTKSTVSGITISITNSSDQLWPYNATLINLTKSGGWDEGSYEVVANITRMNAARTTPTGSDVNVRTWFEVRLFEVWGWSESWSNHPKSNVSLRVHVGTSGAGYSFYNGIVNATITAVTNTRTGTVLARGTDYTATNATANPSSAGDLNVSIIPVTSLPVGQYRATVRVTDCNPDCSSGKSVTTDVWFEVKAFQLSISASRYEYASTDDVDIWLSAYSPGGGSFNLTDARIIYLSKCTISACTTVNLSTLNTVFSNTGGNTLKILSTSNLATGWYWANILVNDTQNATDTGGASFQIKSFGVSGYVPNPSSTRYSYYINESIVLNVTGTPETNITNATLSIWDCPPQGSCVEKKLERTIGHVLSAKNELVNITPPGFNNTWPTGSWGWAGYSINVNAKKGNDTTTFWTYAGVQFPSPWNITGLYTNGPTANITANVTVFVDYDSTQRLANATVNVSRVLASSTWTEMNTTANAWNTTGNVTNLNGFARVTIRPNVTNFNWTMGGAAFEIIVQYGNATTKGYYYTTIAQKTFYISSKSLKNSTLGGANTQTLVTAPNCPNNCPYNLTVRLYNPTYNPDATVSIAVTTSRLNSSATVNNRSAAVLTAQSIPAGAFPQFNFTYNVTGITNVTHVIQLTPTSSDFSAQSTSFSYTSA
ncbi:MAG: hypothetical protein HYT72_04780 [Candidatus Aenigmarchaeota archaeon]|nr:hypothetical protein [Candidatus Aenigmarchaeota archaeon]